MNQHHPSEGSSSGDESSAAFGHNQPYSQGSGRNSSNQRTDFPVAQGRDWNDRPANRSAGDGQQFSSWGHQSGPDGAAQVGQQGYEGAFQDEYRQQGGGHFSMQGQHGEHGGGIHDPEYRQWRTEQMRSFDEDYQKWRQERFRKFSDEFSTWRQGRRQTESGQNSSGDPIDQNEDSPVKQAGSSAQSAGTGKIK